MTRHDRHTAARNRICRALDETVPKIIGTRPDGSPVYARGRHPIDCALVQVQRLMNDRRR